MSAMVRGGALFFHQSGSLVPAIAEPIHEVLLGVLHWTARHPTARLEFGSHYLVAEGILIDPITPPEGLEWFDGREIKEILLTNRHPTRSTFDLEDRLGVTVRAADGVVRAARRSGAAVRRVTS